MEISSSSNEAKQSFQAMQLMLNCCKMLSEGSNRFAEMSLSEVDANSFVDLCEENRLLLVAHQIISTNSSPCFKQINELLSLRAKPRILSQLKLHRLLFEVHKILKENQIEHVFLKGPLLNHLLFGEKILRYSKDLDILIQKKDVLNADKVLKEAGFISPISYAETLIHYHCNSRKDLIYSKKNHPFTLELHWQTDFNLLFSSKKNNWTAHKTTIKYKEYDFPVLADEYNVLYLCMHAAKHGFTRLHWLFDILLFMKQKNIDSHELLKLAKKNHLQSMVMNTLALTGYYFATDLIDSSSKKHTRALSTALKKYNTIQSFNKAQLSHAFVRRITTFSGMHQNPIRQFGLYLKLTKFFALASLIRMIFFYMNVESNSKRSTCDN